MSCMDAQDFENSDQFFLNGVNLVGAPKPIFNRGFPGAQVP